MKSCDVINLVEVSSNPLSISFIFLIQPLGIRPGSSMVWNSNFGSLRNSLITFRGHRPSPLYLLHCNRTFSWIMVLVLWFDEDTSSTIISTTWKLGQTVSTKSFTIVIWVLQSVAEGSRKDWETLSSCRSFYSLSSRARHSWSYPGLFYHGLSCLFHSYSRFISWLYHSCTRDLSNVPRSRTISTHRSSWFSLDTPISA